MTSQQARPNTTGLNPHTVNRQSTFCLPLRDTNTPTEAPTQAPTNAPTEDPTDAPTEPPTEVPTDAPTEPPTEVPTDAPTAPPTEVPTNAPTEPPTEVPTDAPTEPPTEVPTDAPTEPPTEGPTGAPTEVPPTEGPEVDCVDSWIGDDYCDDQNNNAGCQWDGGDCCGNDSDSWDNFCSACECLDPDFDEEGPECDDIWTAKKCQRRKSKGKCNKKKVQRNCQFTCELC